MPHPELDRHDVIFKPLSARKNKVRIEQARILPTEAAPPLTETGAKVLAEAVQRLRNARNNDKPRMLVFGAHAIKNGLAPVFIHLIESGWITHLATNGAGIIHDWEFAYQGESSEDVRENVTRGEFGTWEETGYYLNLAINVGAYHGLGYGESVGAMVENEGLDIPSEAQLKRDIEDALFEGDTARAAAAADLLGVVLRFKLEGGWMAIPHPFKQYGLQAAAYRLSIPFTSHPMFGHDIIYEHPMNLGAAIGRTAQRDFLTYAQAVSRIEGGVYLSIGSAVMSPMIFEKSLSMSQNLAIQRGAHIDNHYMVVVDLQESHWDWTRGEPPEDNPDYYLRFNKSFSRMGGQLRYLTADNRAFLLNLVRALESAS